MAMQVVARVFAAAPSGAKLMLRFEPFILAVEARNLTIAQRLLHAARLAGYRESGMTLGSDGRRIMVCMPACRCRCACA